MMLIDFDGTIIDLWPRYYAVFCELTKADIAPGDYRLLKKKIKKDGEIIKHLGLEMPKDYFEKKAVYLEDQHFLSMDRLLVSLKELTKLSTSGNAAVLTKRRNSDNFLWEFDRLGLCETQLKTICVTQPKVEWAAQNVYDEAVVIGDDVRDLQVAALPGIKAVMVLSGLGTEEDFLQTCIEHETYQSLGDYINKKDW